MAKKKTIEDFKSLAEYEKYVAASKKLNDEKPKKEASKKKTVDTGQPVDESVWRVIHYYKSDNIDFATASRDARQEKKFAGEGMRVFLHDHTYGNLCKKKCREQD